MRSGREVLRTSSQFPVLGSQLKPLASAFLLGTENRELRTRISVIRSFHEPAAAQQVVYEAVEGDGFSVSQGEIPFVARPGFAFPPIAGKAPGAGLPEHFALYFFFSTNQMHWLAIFQSHVGAQRRTKAAQGGDGGIYFGGVGSSFLRRFVCDLGDEAAHAESVGMVSVEQLQRSDFLLANHAGDAGEGEFEFFRFGGWREEQASLGRTGARGFGGEMNFHDGGSRGMRVEIELQEFEKNFGVEHGKGERKGAGEFWLTRVKLRRSPVHRFPLLAKAARSGASQVSIFSVITLAGDADVFIVDAGQVCEVEGEAQFLRGQGPRSQTRTELFEQAIQQEGQRFEQDDGMIEFDRLFKGHRRFHRNQRADRGAARQFLQVETLLPETFAQRYFRQGGQRAQVSNAPSIEGFEQTVGLFFLLAL